MRLHLCCGSSYLDGYENVELPQNKHLKADVYADIRTLSYEPDSIDEIVISHAFEHFDRATALFLLEEWNKWLKIGGILHIVVPDFEENARVFLSDHTSFEDKQKLLRHIFGTHEADWALHYDGWYFDKFRFVLNKFGFDIARADRIIVQSEPIRYDLNIVAVKQSTFNCSIETHKDILTLSSFGDEPSLLGTWINKINVLKEQQQYFPKQKERLILIFSKDRATQLDCMLSTLHKFCLDIEKAEIKVLYTCSHIDHEVQYARLLDFYPNVEFCKETHFRNNTMYILSGYQYCMLSVDDCVFTHPFYYSDAITALGEKDELIGFSLRLGKNIKTSYMKDGASQSIPPYISEKGILQFNWINRELDFGYPLELSSSIYRTDDIINIIARVPFNNPNSMEAILDCHKNLLEGRDFLACYETSVAFCNAINKVQVEFIANRSGSIPVAHLADNFHSGLRIDTSPFENYVSQSPHEEHELIFINRNLTNDSPLLSIIIPTFNGFNNLKECLWSIFRNTDAPYEIFVIDNMKDSESGEYVSNIDKIHLIRNQENVGSTVARNQALPQAQGKYIVFLDDDVIVTRHWDKKFLEYFEKVSQVGMIGARSNWASGPQLVTTCPYSNLLELERFSQDFNKHEKGLIGSPRLVSFCMMMRKEVLNVIGAMDERFNIFYEDDDYSLRAFLAKLNPAVAKNIYVHHTGGPLQAGDPTYNEKLQSSWTKYKQKWGIPDHIKSNGDVDYKPIFEKEYTREELYIPFKGAQ